VALHAVQDVDDVEAALDEALRQQPRCRRHVVSLQHLLQTVQLTQHEVQPVVVGARDAPKYAQ
jgi:hypothetical protein